MAPIYDYQCECGLRFEASSSMADRVKPKQCPVCKNMAPRRIPDKVTGTFNVETKGIDPQNTGVHSVDANWDRVIGQDSEKKWDGYAKHQKRKDQISRDLGVTREDLSLMPDGNYVAAKPKEKAIHQRALAINAKAMETFRAEDSKKSQ